MAHFELQSEGGTYTVTAASSNQYVDGAIRIEPPVRLDADDWEFVNRDADAKFTGISSGKQATMVSYMFDDKPSLAAQLRISGEYEERVHYLAQALVGHVSLLESKEQFIKYYEGE